MTNYVELLALYDKQEEENQALKARVAELESALLTAINVFDNYEMSVDDYPNIKHVQMKKGLESLLEMHNLEQQALICEKLAKETYTDTLHGQTEQVRLYQQARALREQAEQLKEQG